MASPFPGMDPFIEAQRWSGFHHRFITQLGDLLVEKLRPRYEVEPEERIYVETTPDAQTFRADVAVSKGPAFGEEAGHLATTLGGESTVYLLPMPVEEREPYLVIRRTGEQEVVAVIELLSPTNKRPGSDGRKEYLAKRHSVLRSTSHLVEIDLLLAGQRLPTIRPLKPETDYCAFICRAGQRPRAHVHEWTLRQPLPRIPIPLLDGDADATLELQPALSTVYERSGYDYSLDYSRPLESPLREADEPWVRQVLAARSGA
jgi:Protein of unknown function (DUF4058)